MHRAAARKIAEARSDIARALVLDPLNAYAYRVAGTVSLIAGDNVRALGEFDRALDRNPTGALIHALRAQVYAALGRWKDARDSYAKEPSEIFKQQGLAIAHWKLANPNAARTAFRALIAGGNSVDYQKAQVLAEWGEPNAALNALETAHKNGDAGLAQLHTDQFLVTLRNMPRFLALQRAIGFVS